MKILYVTTISNTVNAFFIPHIKMLVDEGHTVDVAFNVEQEVKREVYEMGCKVHHLPFKRSPMKKGNLRAYKKLNNIINIEEYDLVHTHTPIASAIVRLACRKNNNIRVFYTAHGFHFYKGAPFINWLLYYPTEKWLGKYTDVLITINNEDYTIAKKKFKAKRVEYIPGVGMDLKKFTSVEIDRGCKRKELGLSKDAFVVLSVGELNKNKNHEVVIRAIANINNPNIHYVICGQGELENYLKNLSKDLGIENQVHLLGFRNDITEICKSSDMFVFPSFREGLSVALMEAMALGKPIIASNIRGNRDLIETNIGGYLFNPSNANDLYTKIKSLIQDDELRQRFGVNNKNKIDNYSIDIILAMVKETYEK